jgi:hypothetical protein
LDKTLESSHWLGAGLVDEVMRDVAPENGEWCVLSRDRLRRWSDEQGYRRLRYITNNQRYFTLDPQSRPNRTSCALGVTLPRLSADFGDRFSMHHDWHEYPLEKL